MEEEVPSIKTRYPPTWKARKHISRLVRDILLSVRALLLSIFAMDNRHLRPA